MSTHITNAPCKNMRNGEKPSMLFVV